jgi:hypothetical protein
MEHSAACSFLALNAQARSAKDLAKQNAKTQKDLEDYKKDIVEKIEAVKGQIARQNEFVSETVDAKSAAYNKLFIATANCYRELQNLARGEHDETKVEAAETSLREAEALAANLDAGAGRIIAPDFEYFAYAEQNEKEPSEAPIIQELTNVKPSIVEKPEFNKVFDGRFSEVAFEFDVEVD